MSEKRTTEHAEMTFQIAFNHINARKDRNNSDMQYFMYIALGMGEISRAIREVYDKLELIDKKLS